MLTGTASSHRGMLLAAIARWSVYFTFWLVLYGVKAPDFVVGALAAVAATLTSLLLLPVEPGRVAAFALAKLAVRFFAQSIVAGVDVARRALHPRMPLQQGFIVYPVRFAPGTTRNLFTTLTSLLPGTVPAGDRDGQLVYHCLDVSQPIAAQLAEEEE